MNAAPLKDEIRSTPLGWARLSSSPASTWSAGPEVTRLCGEGKGDCHRDEDCAGTLQCDEDNCVQSGGLWDAENDCCEGRYASDRHCSQVSFNYN